MSNLDRRQFSLIPLLGLPLLRGSASAKPWTATQWPPPPRPERLDLAARLSMASGEEVDPAPAFALLKAAGFSGVEVDFPHLFHPGAVSEASKANDLPVHGVRMTRGQETPLSDLDPNVRATGRERLERGLRLCSELGGTTVSIAPGRVTRAVSDADAWNLVRHELQTIVPLLEELDVRLALRPVEGNFLMSPMEAARFVDELGCERVGCQLDVSWCSVHGYPEHWAHIVGARICKVDLADFDRARADREGLAAGFDVEFGAGNLQGVPLLESLAHALYSGWVTVGGPLSSLEECSALAVKAKALLEI